MALQWDWDEKIGEVTVEETFNGETRQIVESLYEGNAFLIFINEWEEGEKKMYSLCNFFLDKVHAKNCLGLVAGKRNMFTGYMTIKKLRIDKSRSRNYKDIVAMFAQAFNDITIELYGGVLRL